ncbi:MAG TPA: hypothetical protein VFI73_04690 [Candidatus Nitrosopolaris sp.]|nr:hypothetical protein [Candidatus Nitrosopolaris sp.]
MLGNTSSTDWVEVCNKVCRASSIDSVSSAQNTPVQVLTMVPQARSRNLEEYRYPFFVWRAAQR